MVDEYSIDMRDYEAYLEKSVVVMLRDKRHLYGIMKSFDQFNSITLDKVVERIFHNDKYAEKIHQLFIIRGENISIIGLGSFDIPSNLSLTDFDVLSNEMSTSAQGCQDNTHSANEQ
ncbi:LSM domain-containing protein [Ordospora colligata OC4]|uniref:U6 snRNA-associated Sm-like protein LSm1 n=1 Tax=Ordospora colligata OC4 TaxID=1354746 RepID=A0A0B2ULF2_9MICR|nr:LSM domain-containing protein [Ordospora colligata OC4]KHN69785.1 LSM domain-containing protein [Ordospora colligata OC4]TBU15655.1 LSM domain-containing protein [Ordospora colligata]